MTIERHHLSVLREVARAGGVTAAAERLNLSQSAVSHAVAKLEDQHGVKLWRRQGRGLRLTQAGEFLLDLAERLVPEFEHAERVLADYARGRRGLLRVGMECHPCEKWLMRVTAPYLGAWPDVDLDVRTAFRYDGIAALQAHEIDALVTPDPVATEDLRFHPVFDYQLALAVREDHPLAGRDHVEPQDLDDEVLLTFPVPHERLDIYMRFLAPAGRRPKRQVGVETAELMIQLVAAGRGVSVLPDWLLRETAEAQPPGAAPVVAVKIGPEGIDKSINIGLRASDTDADYLAGFLEIAAAVDP